MIRRNQSQIILCQECHGEGTLLRSEFKGHTDGVHYFDVPCTVCGGTGRMVQTIYEELTKMGEKPQGSLKFKV